MNEEGAKLVVQVQPDASRNQVVGFKEGILSVKIAATPLKGKANQELIKYLADFLNVARSRLAVIRGQSSRKKLISIKGYSQDEIMRTATAKSEEGKT